MLKKAKNVIFRLPLSEHSFYRRIYVSSCLHMYTFFQIEKHENGVITIDTGYIRKGFTATHLVKEKGHCVFLDSGTTHSLDDFLKVLKQENIPPENACSRFSLINFFTLRGDEFNVVKF